jgi:hypothetical protein
LHLRPKLLHDGSATTIEQAIAKHGGQAAASRSAFNALSASDTNAMLAAMAFDESWRWKASAIARVSQSRRTLDSG